MDVFAEFLPFPGLTHASKVSTRARNKVSSHSVCNIFYLHFHHNWCPEIWWKNLTKTPFKCHNYILIFGSLMFACSKIASKLKLSSTWNFCDAMKLWSAKNIQPLISLVNCQLNPNAS